MGLASSQARMLLITARKSDLEYRAQMISQRKLLLATKSEQVATDYSKAVANKRWMMSSVDGNGNQTQISMNYSNLKTGGYVIKDASTGKAVSDRYSYTMTSSTGAKQSVSLPNLINSGYRVVDKTGSILIDSAKALAQDLVNETTPNGTSIVDLTKVKKAELAGTSITTGGYTYNPAQNTAEYAQQKLESGEWKVQKASDGSYSSVSLSSFTTIDGTKTTNKSATSESYLAQKLESGEWYIENPKAPADRKVIDLNNANEFVSVLDSRDDTAAEAKYKSESLKLQSQDKQLDLELKQIETQHKALETEYDSVKKVMDKNIEVSFKIFAQG